LKEFPPVLTLTKLLLMGFKYAERQIGVHRILKQLLLHFPSLSNARPPYPRNAGPSVRGTLGRGEAQLPPHLRAGVFSSSALQM